MKHLICLLVVLSFSGCKVVGESKPLCAAAKLTAQQAAGGVASVLECAASAEISKDLLKAVESSQICEAKAADTMMTLAAQNLIGNVICPPVAKLVTELSVKQIPKNWECSANIAKDKMNELILKGCKAATNK